MVSLTGPLAAQETLESQTGEPPERIDILVEQDDLVGPTDDCTADQEAAIISGEIVVCRRLNRETARLYDKESAERRHAQRTMGPQPVDVAGAGIFRGKPTVSGMCFIPPCPKPPVLMIDIEALPEAPPGSDADRIARGLAPRGRDGDIAAAVAPPTDESEPEE